MYENNEWEPRNDKPSQPTKPKALVPLITLDDIPSPTPAIVDYINDEEILCILLVWGHGVLTLRARIDSGDPNTGTLSSHGVSLFTDAEIKPVLSEKRRN
jgi:hypothetical protein